MFENSMIMLFANNNDVYQLPVDEDTRKEIIQIFLEGKEALVDGKSEIKFNGSYKPEEDEYLSIINYQLDDKIKNAISNPTGVTAFKEKREKTFRIRAIFIGEKIENPVSEEFFIIFQLFRKEQYLSRGGLNLFFDSDTFKKESKFGISISKTVECYFNKDELQFHSFFFARQIFDLNEYYRSATDSEVDAFTNNNKLNFIDKGIFKHDSTSWIRKRVAMINDSKVLDKYSAEEIKSMANGMGIEIQCENEKIVIPSGKEQMKVVIGFLAEEAYQGPFSNYTFLANSKRRVGI